MKKRILYGKTTRCEWESKDIAYLCEHYPVECLSDLAEHFGISAVTIRHKALELGLEKSQSYSNARFKNRYVCNYKNERYKNYKHVV
jgi:Zn-dependent peptidase ImmA (M78 family)